MLPAPSIADRERQDSANSLDRAARIAGEGGQLHMRAAKPPCQLTT